MAKLHGTKGVITLSGMAGFKSCSIDKKSEPLDTTVIGDTTKKYIAGARSFTLEAEAVSASPARAEDFAGAEGLRSFEISGEAEAIDISLIGDIGDDDLPYKSFHAGPPEWKDTLEILLDAGTPPPLAGATYTFGSADAVITSVNVTDEVAGMIGYSLGIQGTGALPVALTIAPGATVAFEMAADTTDIASGNIIVTTFKISGSVGGLVTYAITGQGTGPLTEGVAE